MKGLDMMLTGRVAIERDGEREHGSLAVSLASHRFFTVSMRIATRTLYGSV